MDTIRKFTCFSVSRFKCINLDMYFENDTYRKIDTQNVETSHAQSPLSTIYQVFDGLSCVPYLKGWQKRGVYNCAFNSIEIRQRHVFCLFPKHFCLYVF